MLGVTFHIITGEDNKGHMLHKHVDDYCVVDLETTGIPSPFEPAYIIEISAIKIRNNQIVDEYSELINPKCPIPSDATAVNHITDDMVKDAPFLENVIDCFLDFVGHDVIVGYNYARFDNDLICNSVQSLKEKNFTNDYLDIFYVARRSLPELENHKLKTVCEHYNLSTTNHHRALTDCYLTKSCYDKLYEEFGDIAFKNKGHASSGKGRKYSPATLALQELQELSIVGKILVSGTITNNEGDLLRCWLDKHKNLIGNGIGYYMLNNVIKTLDDVLINKQITKQGVENLKKIVEPVEALTYRDSISTLVNKHVCLSGNFNFGEKREIENLIKQATPDCIIDKKITSKTNFLVMGAQGSEAYTLKDKGTKFYEAQRKKKNGQDIEIVKEEDFISAVEEMIKSIHE